MQPTSLTTFLLFITVLLTLPACSSQQKIALTEPEPESNHVLDPKSDPDLFITDPGPNGICLIISKTIKGRLIPFYIFNEDSKETILILATIHGNESAGTPLLKEMVLQLKDNPSLTHGRRIVLVPIANPDGYAAKTRSNAAGVDLNRNFPAENYSARRNRGNQALSEPESKAIADLFDLYKPDRVVSIHQPIGCIDYDGPAKDLAHAIAKAAKLPVRKLGLRKGSLGSFIGKTNNTAIITLELPSSASRLSQSWNKYGQALLTAISFSDETIAAME